MEQFSDKEFSDKDLQSRHVIGTEISLKLVEGWYVLARVLLKLSLIVSRNSGNRANPENDSP